MYLKMVNDLVSFILVEAIYHKINVELHGLTRKDVH